MMQHVRGTVVRMDLYLLFKALHIVAFVAWFAGLFYLPRLFVYHVDAPAAAYPMLCTMERKLYAYIMVPAMLAVLVFGLLTAWKAPYVWSEGWFHLKLTLVAALVGYHHYLGALRRRFAAGRNVRSAKFYRVLNEVPTLGLIIVVFLAVFKWA